MWVDVREGKPAFNTALIDDLARKYLGVDSYPYRTPDERRVTVLVEPDKYLGLPG